MIIFFIDRNAKLAAIYHNDKHVVETAHRVLDGGTSGRKIKRWGIHDYREDILYKATHILVKGYSDLTGLSINDSSAELVDYKRGEDVSLFDDSHHLASSMKRLDNYINLS